MSYVPFRLLKGDYLPFHIDYLMAAKLVLLLQYAYTKEALIIDHLW